jgi:hypothetical protein
VLRITLSICIEVLFDAAALDADVIADSLARAGYETRTGGSIADSKG